MESGYLRADSNNLPRISVSVVVEFISNDSRFNAPEIRGVKQASSSREEYGDAAVGYVQLKREGNLCTLQGRVCPEHKIRNKPYCVTLVVDEEEQRIEDVKCSGCAAANGGCKHAMAFLMWCHRRSEEPSPTEVKCYWVKPKLSSAVDKELVTAKSWSKKCPSKRKVSGFLEEFISMSNKRKVSSVLYETVVLEPINPIAKLSMHYLCVKFFKNDISGTANDFLLFAAKAMDETLCSLAFAETAYQADSPMWHELRYGRITASRLHEATRCRTEDGSLVNSILGAYNSFTSKAMERGKTLEPLVLKELSSKLQVAVENCGIQLHPQYPIYGASADGCSYETKEYVIEVKCPTTEEAIKNYLCLKSNTVMPKVKHQMFLQMLLMKKSTGLLCVASPKFESNKSLILQWVQYDEKQVKEALFSAEQFWKKNIFPKLKEISS